MAILKSAILNALRTQLRGEFKLAFDAANPESLAKKIATVVTSSTASNTYAWLGNFPQMKEWVGDRVIKDLKEGAYEIQNKVYEATLGVQRTDIEDDNLGQYRILAQSMAQEAAGFDDRQLALLLKNGASSLCYDGQNFFDTDHPLYPNADGTGTAKKSSNIYGAGTTEPWYLLSLDRPLKPFIIQQRIAKEFEAITETNNETVFMKDKYLYGIRARGNYGYGLWQQALGSKVDLTAAAFEAAYIQMFSLKRDGGDPMGIRPTHLVVSPSFQSKAEAIVKAITLANGAGNTNYGKCELIVSPWLA